MTFTSQSRNSSTVRRPLALRIGLAIAATITLITAPAGVAQAKGGDHPVPVNNVPADIPADVCGFPIHIGVIFDREYWVKRTDNPDGSTTSWVAGPLWNRLTNLNTGASIAYDNGGPGSFTTYPDGHATFDFQGHSMAWIRAAHQADLGKPAFRLINGHVRGVMDANGDIVEISGSGKVVDGCALLSAAH
jgi:hypothetical protein